MVGRDRDNKVSKDNVGWCKRIVKNTKKDVEGKDGQWYNVSAGKWRGGKEEEYASYEYFNLYKIYEDVTYP